SLANIRHRRRRRFTCVAFPPPLCEVDTAISAVFTLGIQRLSSLGFELCGLDCRPWAARFGVGAEVEETLKRLQSQKGVQGIIVVNTEGIPIKSTMDNPTTTQYANLMHNFILKARSTVREIDPQNDLTFLRIRSKKNEIMVAPDKDYFLIVIQNPTE
uniref:Dynein light chain roadblock-type 1 n=1 Tax=Rattus norvegicus TaxID=10116 RepID=A0A8L2QTT3_RAT